MSEIPLSYLTWCIGTVRLSSGLRLAVADELRRRNVEAPAVPTPPEPTCRRCPGAAVRYLWQEDRLGRKQIGRRCGSCNDSLGIAPQLPEFIARADANASATPVLDALLLADAEGVPLRSDGAAAEVGDWRKASPRLKELVRQKKHLLGSLLGKTGEN